MPSEVILFKNDVNTSWSVFGESTRWEAVATNDGDTSYMYDTSGSNQSLNGIVMTGYPTLISDLEFNHISRNTIASGSRLRDRITLNSTTLMNGNNVTPSTTYTLYTRSRPTNGDTAAAWTKDEINGIGTSGIDDYIFIANTYVEGELRTTYADITVTYTGTVTTAAPTTAGPTTVGPTTLAPTTLAPTTAAPTTLAPTTTAPTTLPPTTLAPTTLAPTTVAPTTLAPTTIAPTTLPPTTLAPTTIAPTTIGPTTLPPTTLPPTTLAPTTPAPTTSPPTFPPTAISLRPFNRQGQRLRLTWR